MSHDQQFRSLLGQRIQSYRDHERLVQSRIDQLVGEKESIADRRKSAEALYEAEFGEPLTREVRLWMDTTVEVGPLTGLSWAEAMTRVMQDAGAPLHVKDIWRHLQEGGFRTDSRDPVRSIVAIAVRDQSIVRAGPNRYGLAAPAPAPATGAAEGGDAVA